MMDRRRQQPELEIRRAATVEAGGDTLHGYAAKFDRWSEDLGGFRERIAPGAFSRSLREDDGSILALASHDLTAVLGRTGAKTLQLREDGTGLRFELSLPDTSHGRDLRELVKRGDVSGMSFGFIVRRDGDSWEVADDGTVQRTLLDVDLREVSVTAAPAYQDTTVAQRHLRQRTRTRLAELERFLAIARLK